MNAPAPVNLEAKIDALSERMDLLLERQRAVAELMDESGPILHAVMQAGTTQLADLEDRGYFDFGRATLRLLDRIVSSYSADDVDQLGDAVVSILDTVRNVTQPDVLAMANEATDVLHNADTLKPVGVMGALKKSRDDDVQRGIAVLLEVLRHVGKASAAATGDPKQRKLARHLAPRKRRAAPLRRRAPSAPGRPTADPACELVKAPSTLVVPGFALDAQGFLADPQTWTREYATLVGPQLGIEELTDDHWTVIDTIRGLYLENGKSPNVRKMATASGLGTGAIYTLFKKAPGSRAARIAGIPKPVGCI